MRSDRILTPTAHRGFEAALDLLTQPCGRWPGGRIVIDMRVIETDNRRFDRIVHWRYRLGIPGTVGPVGFPGTVAPPGIPGTGDAAAGTPGTDAAPGIPGTDAAPGIPGTDAAPGIPGTDAA